MFILLNCPHLNDRDLENLLKILISLEKSNIRYDLLSNLAKLESADLEDLNEILSKWSIRDSKIILTEIYRRIDLIENLERFTEIEKAKIEKFNDGEENFICMENEGKIKWLEKDSLVSIETLQVKTVVLVKPRITDFSRDGSHKNTEVCF